MTALLTADEVARLRPGERLVIVRPGELTDNRTLEGYLSAVQYLVAPQDWVALTGQCPTCGGSRLLPMPPEAAGSIAISAPCRDCRDGRRIVPLYRAVDPALDPVDVCQEQLRLLNRFDAEALVRDGWNPSPVLVGRGIIEVVPVVKKGTEKMPQPYLIPTPFLLSKVWLIHNNTPRLIALHPLPVPGRDFGIVIDCVEIAS